MRAGLFTAAVLASLQLLSCKGKEPAATAEGKEPVVEAPNEEVTITEQQAKDAKLEVNEIAEQAVSDSVITSGRVTFDDLLVAHIFSPVTGRVMKINAELGQRVKKGEALAYIESPDIGLASSDLGKAQADLTAAEHDYKRKKALYDEHAASQADVETAEDNYGKAKAEYARALQKTNIFHAAAGVSGGFALTAAIDGEVIVRNVSPFLEVQGQYGGGSANELFTIGELNKVWVMADVYEIDLARVKVGQRVDIEVVAYPGKHFAGVVDLVASTLDPVTRTTRVRCKLDNKDRFLRPEMYATVRLYVEEQKTLAIPHDAILRLGEQTVVFVDEGKTPEGKLRFKRVPILVDEGEGDKWVPLLRGPKKGERIVTSGAILLSGML
ncbi:MAG: efflux RND transporter periplasmic adaptor subunit [Polyangiales bacterium]